MELQTSVLFFIVKLLTETVMIMKKIKSGRFMNLHTDFAFKKLLGTKRNKALLINLLNTLLNKPNKIIDVQYLQTEHLGHTEKDRKAIFDIYCITEEGEQFIIEMQVARQPHFMDRILFYSTFPIQEQAQRGDWNYELKPLYVITFLDFNLFESIRYINHISMISEETGEKMTNKQNVIVIELPKFRKTLKQLKTELDRWLYCFRYLGQIEERPEELSGEIFEKLFEQAEINKLTPDNMLQYEKSVLEYADVKRALDYSVERGIEKGVKKVAKNLLKLQISIADIEKATGLTPEQIKLL
jgi:predicted transposase/invertase (TIGR01784 family)